MWYMSTYHVSDTSSIWFSQSTTNSNETNHTHLEGLSIPTSKDPRSRINLQLYLDDSRQIFGICQNYTSPQINNIGTPISETPMSSLPSIGITTRHCLWKRCMIYKQVMDNILSTLWHQPIDEASIPPKNRWIKWSSKQSNNPNNQTCHVWGRYQLARTSSIPTSQA